MNDKTSLLVSNQVPDFVRSEYPKFLAFMEAYYDFLQQYTIDFETLRDVDLTSDEFIFFLRQEFLNKFPNAEINERRLIKIIRNLYSAKGTVNAVELLFRIFFSEAVVVRQPGKNILRASDGRWLFENSITLKQIYGTFDANDRIQLRVENVHGIFFIDVDRVEIIDAEHARFFYRNTTNIQFETDETAYQRIEILDQRLIDIDSIDGLQELIDDGEQIIDIVEGSIIKYRGRLIKSPSYLQIVSPGRDWRKGQVFFIEGTERNTLARVVEVGPLGELVAAEIYEYGAGHAEDQLIVVSPYPNKPGNVTYDILNAYLPVKNAGDVYTDLAELESLVPSPLINDVYIVNEHMDGILLADLYVYRALENDWVFSGEVPADSTYIIDHVLDIEDNEAVVVYEEVLGISSVLNMESYYLGDTTNASNNYASEDYNGSTAFYNKTSAGVSSSITLVDPELTVERWFASRSTLLFKYDYAIKYRGVFQSDEGQLSNPNIRLQDNYFYQMFSYVVETQRGIDEYRSTLNLIHPAGLKFFSELAKTALLVFPDSEAIRAISQDKIYANELLDAFDTTPEIWIVKNVLDDEEDTLTTTADITSTAFVKLNSETSTPSETTAKIFNKAAVGETVSQFETLDKLISATLPAELVTQAEALILNNIKAVQDNSEIPTDSLAFNINKTATGDTTTLADTGASLEQIIWNTETYSDSDYSANDNILTLG